MVFNTFYLPFHEDNVTKKSVNGVIIHGPYLEGCKWNMEKMVLDESERGILFVLAPCIEISPTSINDYKNDGKYRCPLYKTTDRTG